MSVEADLRAVLVGYAPLLAQVPQARISIDAVAKDAVRPYIVFLKQDGRRSYGLDNTYLGSIDTIDIHCVGTNRRNAIAVRELVELALVAGGVPPTAVRADFDPDNGIEAEIVTVDW